MKPYSGYSRRSFLKLAVAAAAGTPFITQAMKSRPPSKLLGHASFGAGGMAWEDLNQIGKFKSVELVAVAEVDLGRVAELRKRFPHTRIYQDWRDLLDQENHRLDSVNVSVPDHMHAPIAMSAMELGKDVYCQKPLAHDLFEVRRLAQVARDKKLVTQMGIQIHSTTQYRTATLLVRAGAIGKVKEVHSWCPKSWGDPSPRPDRSDPLPAGFDWNMWLGVCSERPYIGDAYYHPGNWRKRLDFGTGTFGDMGCHIFDPVFTALEITSAPLTVRSEGPAPNAWNWAIDSRIHYTFAGTAHTAEKTVKVTWYDGAQKPPAEIKALLEGDDYPDTGSVLVGTQGTMVIPHIAKPLLYPDAKFKNLKFPEVTASDHWGTFVESCRTREIPSASFDYSGPLTEAVLLGGVASRFPQTTLEWNSERLTFNLAEATALVRREYRRGWKVKGLSLT
jgi:predicted dehydrogenase